MKKSQIKPEEIAKDTEELINLVNSLNKMDINNFINFDDKKFNKEVKKLTKKINTKYNKYLPKEDLDTEE